jgi:hypothetical protein
METANTPSLSARWKELGVERDGLVRAFRSFTAGAKAFRKESESHETV